MKEAQRVKCREEMDGEMDDAETEWKSAMLEASAKMDDAKMEWNLVMLKGDSLMKVRTYEPKGVDGKR